MTHLSIAQYRSLLLEYGLDCYPPSVWLQFLLGERKKQVSRMKDAEFQIRRIDQTIDRLRKAG